MQRNQVWPTFVIFQTLRRRDTQKSFKWQVKCSENNVWKVVHICAHLKMKICVVEKRICTHIQLLTIKMIQNFVLNLK